MKFIIHNPIAGGTSVFDNKEAADIKLEEIKQQLLEREAYRFTIAKEVVDGNNTTWMNADLANDPEDGEYQVFNTLTGLHEKIQGLSAAITRQGDIKQEFVAASGLVVHEVSDEEALKYQPVLIVA